MRSLVNISLATRSFLAEGKPAQPDFRDAYRTQLVLDAIMDSAKGGTWVGVKKG
jgi:predicted dehydrogenase